MSIIKLRRLAPFGMGTSSSTSSWHHNTTLWRISYSLFYTHRWVLWNEIISVTTKRYLLSHCVVVGNTVLWIDSNWRNSPIHSAKAIFPSVTVVFRSFVCHAFFGGICRLCILGLLCLAQWSVQNSNDQETHYPICWFCWVDVTV